MNYRKKALKRKVRICEICSSPHDVIVHHKDRNRLNNHISNLQILCYSCHKRSHLLFNEGYSVVVNSNKKHGIFMSRIKYKRIMIPPLIVSSLNLNKKDIVEVKIRKIQSGETEGEKHNKPQEATS